MENQDVIYFELNNWTPVHDYPLAEPFDSWMGDDLNLQFLNEEWIKENKLCVLVDFIDQSLNFCITATKEWVEKHCPNLLTEFTNFTRQPDEEGSVYGRFGHLFLEYEEDNFGLKWEPENE